jgi:hypothetical protein
MATVTNRAKRSLNARAEFANLLFRHQPSNMTGALLRSMTMVMMAMLDDAGDGDAVKIIVEGFLASSHRGANRVCGRKRNETQHPCKSNCGDI